MRIGAAFGNFLHRAVHIAHVDDGVFHFLAVHYGFDMETAVSAGMLRADIYSIGFRFDHASNPLPEVFAQGMTAEVIRKQNPDQVGMISKLNPHQIISLPFLPVSGRIYGDK